MTDLIAKENSPKRSILMMFAFFVLLAGMLTVRDGAEAAVSAGPWLGWLLSGMAVLGFGSLKSSKKMIVLGFVMIIWAGWENTFYEMWMRWYPDWKYTDRSLGRRLMGGSSYYSHGPLVPLTSLFVAWFIHKRVGAACFTDKRLEYRGYDDDCVFYINAAIVYSCGNYVCIWFFIGGIDWRDYCLHGWQEFG